MSAAELAARKRERGRAATRARRRREGARCGREKSFNVKVTWAHAHRIDRMQKRDRAEAARRKGNGVGGGGGGERDEGGNERIG